jgi:hypothetical protein
MGSLAGVTVTYGDDDWQVEHVERRAAGFLRTRFKADTKQ